MRIHVVAAVLEDDKGRILLTKRPDHVHQGGLWEFPGGKLELDELPSQGLKRELQEELGVTPLIHRPLIKVTHDYSDKRVLLDVYRVLVFDGEPRGREGQPMVWVAPDDLVKYEMPAADRPIVTAIRLPDRYVFTPPSAVDAGSFLHAVASVLAKGARLVQLRVFGLPRNEHLALAHKVVALCHDRGARLMVNSDLLLAQEVGADGVHLSARQLSTLPSRPTDFDWVCSSCHNEAELRQALALDLDFAVLSPVLPTPSHPDAQPLGWAQFAALLSEATMPVYALGGVNPSLLETAWDAGAQGVAGIRGFWPKSHTEPSRSV